MQSSSRKLTYRRVLVGALAGAGIFLSGLQAPSEAQPKHHDYPGHQHAGDICRGFVVLPNGFAVLSGQAGSQAGATHSSQPMVDKGHGASTAPPHLMGYTHGQAMVPTKDMLCVPAEEANVHRWTATGQPDAPAVTVESLQGVLTRSNRSRASFALTVQQSGTAVDTAAIRVLARMPHHDRRMQGGHGPANDPDVKGLTAQAAGQGRYTLPLVDFTMSGPWLFEIQVQRGTTTQTLYVAPTLGEE